MLDLIKLLDDAFATMRYGAGVRLSWPYESGYTGAEAEKDFRSIGIRVWGRQYATRDGQEYALRVRRQQAQWATYVLRTRLAGKPLPPSRTRRRGSPVGAIGLSGRVIDWFLK